MSLRAEIVGRFNEEMDKVNPKLSEDMQLSTVERILLVDMQNAVILFINERRRAVKEREAAKVVCADGQLPDGEVCPSCGGRRGPSGIGGGTWVHY